MSSVSSSTHMSCMTCWPLWPWLSVCKSAFGLICCLCICVWLWPCVSVSLAVCLSMASYLSVNLSVICLFSYARLSVSVFVYLVPCISSDVLHFCFLCAPETFSPCLSLRHFEAWSTKDPYFYHAMIVAVGDDRFAFMLFEAFVLWLESWKWMCSEVLHDLIVKVTVPPWAEIHCIALCSEFCIV